MRNPNIFLSKAFWLIFTIAVIISMYLYGLKMIGDKTEIAQTKKELQTTKDELSTCRNDNNSKSNAIEQLNKTIAEHNSTISQQVKTLSEKEKTIQDLNNTVTELKNRPPEIVTKYQDRIIYKDRPEPYHQYGKGYGKITLYKICNCYSLQFWIDGEYVGVVNNILSSGASCGQTGTVSKIVLAGKHRIQGKDEENHSWDFYVTVSEDQCLTQGVR